MGTDPGGRDEHQWETVEEFRDGDALMVRVELTALRVRLRDVQRTLPLPAGASEQGVTATYKDSTAFPGCRRVVVG